jgi:UDP-N-acetylmuramyl pentapeptide phosphotransferase/UDP-N-acetylglucosamine-1-phosphate transferase
MKPIVWAGILLIILGVLVFTYQGINYTREKKVLDVGPVHVTSQTHERIPLPPVLGGLALIGGVILVVVGSGSKS